MLKGRDNVHVVSKFINVFVVAGSGRHSWLRLAWFQKISIKEDKKLALLNSSNFLDVNMNEIICLRKCLLQPKFEPFVVRFF